jgi:hypothetical protein
MAITMSLGERTDRPDLLEQLINMDRWVPETVVKV